MKQTMSTQVHTLKEQMVSAEALGPPEEPQMPPTFDAMINRRIHIHGSM